MAFQKIKLIISKKSAAVVKNILYKFNSNLPQINICKKNSDEQIEIEFKIPFEACKTLINEFVIHKLEVVPSSSYIKKILFELQNDYPNLKVKTDANTSESEPLSHKTLKNYEEFLKFMNNYFTGKVDLSENKIGFIKNTINLFIENLRKGAYISSSKSYDNIQHLINIAANQKLKSSPISAICLKAGRFAIDISANTSQNIGELINICNNRDLDCLISAKAAAKFSEVTLSDEKTYETDISIAVKRVNSMWLSTLFDVAQKDLNDSELNSFTKLQEFIKSKRN